MSRRACIGFLVVALCLFVATPPTPVGARAGDDPPAAGRVLVISVPGLRWVDIDRPELPVLRALLDDSAVASLATRVTRAVARPGEAYLTLGSGTRAVAAEDLAGAAFGAREPTGVDSAAEEYARQSGEALPEGGLADLSWPLLIADNAKAEFDPTLGFLGQALADAGVGRGVVGNADVTDPLAGGRVVFGREVVAGLADRTGAVPCGDVSTALLVEDPEAAFGTRLDEAVVVEAARRCSSDRSVVLVEASDLRRAQAFADRAAPTVAARSRAQALRSTDRLVAALLAEVDTGRDAVVVVAPTTAPELGLGVLGIRAPGYPPGLLTSGSTRRAGFVVLADLTPTIAVLAGVPLDEATLEGRHVGVRVDDRDPSERRASFVDVEAAARFRDGMIEPVTIVFVAAVGVLALAAAVVFVRRWRRAEPGLEVGALSLIAFPACTYLAALLPTDESGAVVYWAVVIGGSLAIGGSAWLLRRRWLAPIVVTYGTVMAVVAVSVVVLGSRLQMSTVFGDSPIVAGRFTGINNVTFAFWLAATSALACVLAQVVAPLRVRPTLVAFLAGALAVDVAPMWGADVGGALAGLPSLALLGTGLGRWKVRWRAVALTLVATIGLVVLLGLLDLSRAPADRTHLGRLFEGISSDGVGGLTTVVGRKLGANLRSLAESTWRFVFLPVGVAAGLVAWRARDRVQAVTEALPPARAALPGVAAIAVLGYAVNDSGVAVPGALVGLLVPGLVYLACRVDPEVAELEA